MINLKQRRALAIQLIQAIEEIKQLRREKEVLETKLYTDSLTGIANRRAFDEKLQDLVTIAHSNNEPLALLIADVDGLKRTNDNLGHDKGDELLKSVANAFADAARATDLVGRFGGDEFYAILPGFRPIERQTEEDLFRSTESRYREVFKKQVGLLSLPDELKVDVSFGIAILGPNETAKDLYRRADEACRVNKKHRYDKLAVSNNIFDDTRT